VECMQWVAAFTGALAPSSGLSASGAIPRGFSHLTNMLGKK